jgi:hypothetical protein
MGILQLGLLTQHNSVRDEATYGALPSHKGGGAPGPDVLWREFQHRTLITDMFRIMRSNK